MTDNFYIPPIKQTPQIEKTPEEKRKEKKSTLGLAILFLFIIGFLVITNQSGKFTGEQLGMVSTPFLIGVVAYFLLTGQ